MWPNEQSFKHTVNYFLFNAFRHFSFYNPLKLGSAHMKNTYRIKTTNVLIMTGAVIAFVEVSLHIHRA